MRKVDPQLQAIRAAAKERFLAQKVATATAPSASTSNVALPAHLAHLSAEQLNAPIGSLLADAPEEYRPAKKAKITPDPNAIVIPQEKTSEIAALLAQQMATPPRVLSWNIDGLDEVGGGQGLAMRVLSIARDIARYRPMAVLLQEVIPPALELLSSNKVLGSCYDVLVPKNPPLPYYVAILLDKKRLKRLGEAETVPFTSSQMGRQLLCVTAEAQDAPGKTLMLATAHLESTKDHATERKRQLLQSLRHLRRVVAGGKVTAALLGGDLNIRDDEVKAVLKDLGSEAEGFADVWSFCGAPETERWTWDTTQNSNVGANFACKTRFDRMIFMTPGVSDAPGVGLAAAKAKAKAKAKAVAHPRDGDGWRPTSIRLLGKEKVAGLGRFPSDHWGLLTEWTVTTVTSPTASIPRAVLPIPASDRRVVIDLDA